MLALVSSLVSMYLATAALNSADALSDAAISSIISIACSLMYFWPIYIPKPCSALSSNNELHQAGPFLESLFTVYGEVAAGLPQIEEQPVALEMYICSPNNCVINLAYDVSAHPAHEPENSSNGWLYWEPIGVSTSAGLISFLPTLATR